MGTNMMYEYHEYMNINVSFKKRCIYLFIYQYTFVNIRHWFFFRRARGAVNRSRYFVFGTVERTQRGTMTFIEHETPLALSLDLTLTLTLTLTKTVPLMGAGLVERKGALTLTLTQTLTPP